MTQVAEVEEGMSQQPVVHTVEMAQAMAHAKSGAGACVK